MANKLIPEELDALIQEYLTDGVLTSKEREVILKKAEKMGLDRDEIDLYLDAQVQKIDMEADAAVRKQKGKACPYCGAPIPQLADKCPECGQFITPEASVELKEIIDNLEGALVEFKSGKNLAKSKAIVERYARKASIYYSNNPKIAKILSEINNEKGVIEKELRLLERKSKVKKYFTIICYVAALMLFCFSIFFMVIDENDPAHIGIGFGAMMCSLGCIYGGLYLSGIIGGGSQ